MNSREDFMDRCLQLAALGAQHVAPNPMVGSVLVYKNQIIGEGYHHKYGGPHAEVNCIESVSKTDKRYISHAILYVSLEPCAHFGKTPPCADFIMQHKIPEVVIGSKDPYSEVDGKGIDKLVQNGVKVIQGIGQEACDALNKRFFTFHQKSRPFIVLKWAQTANGKISGNGEERLLISNAYSNKLVHAWRSEEAAILIGRKTALSDNPHLTNRFWKGQNPLRLVVDNMLSLPPDLHLFNKEVSTIVFNSRKHNEAFVGNRKYTELHAEKNIFHFRLSKTKSIVKQIIQACYALDIQSLLVEGGAQLLQSFIDENCWDEARVITNTSLFIDEGLNAPVLFNHKLTASKDILNDRINFFSNYRALE